MVALFHKDALYASDIDQMSLGEAEQLARSIAHFTPESGSEASSDRSGASLLRVLNIHDPRHLNTDELWAARSSPASQKWMSFPIGLRPNGEPMNLIVRSKDTGGFGYHGLLPGTTGSGKSESFISAVYSLALTHAPTVAQVVYIDMKYESAAQDLHGLPHVPAALSNLGADSRGLGERMRMTLLGELARRYELMASVGARDAGVYEEIRRSRLAKGIDDLPPMPVLWIIVDEYLTLFRLYPEWVEAITILGEQGRGAHMKFILGGQRLDLSPLQKIADNIGYRIGLRAESASSSREWVGSDAAFRLPSDEAGHALLKVGERDLVPFRCFYLSANFVVPKEKRERTAVEVQFDEPRRLTLEYQKLSNLDELMAQSESEVDDAPEYILDPVTGRPKRMLDILRDSLVASDPPVPPSIWLEPLEEPEPVDVLVERFRGQPWHLDYGSMGDSPGLPFLVGIVDIPFTHTQEVHALDLAADNLMIVATKGKGKTTALMTMVTSACLMYRPGRVTFMCIGDGAMFKLRDWPHVAGVVSPDDVEGVARTVATVEGIQKSRKASFKQYAIGREQFIARKFFSEDGPVDPKDNFGDTFLVVDDFNRLQDDNPALADRVIALAETGPANGIHVATTQGDWVWGLRQNLKNVSNARVEMMLSDFQHTEMEREAAKRIKALGRPLFGCTPSPGPGQPGREMLVGVPELVHAETGERIGTDIAAKLVQQVSGVEKHFEVKRLPEKISLQQIIEQSQAEDVPPNVLPFAIGESALQTVFLDYIATPNILAVGLKQCGKDTFLAAMGNSALNHFGPDKVKITVIDPLSSLVGRIDGPNVDYVYEAEQIEAKLSALAEELKERLPRAGMSQQELRDRETRGFQGLRHVVIINDEHAIEHPDGYSDPPHTPLSKLLSRAGEIGLNVFAARHTGLWDSVFLMRGFVVAMKNSRAPILFMDNDGETCKIIGNVRSQHLAPGRGILLKEEQMEGILVGSPDVGEF